MNWLGQVLIRKLSIEKCKDTEWIFICQIHEVNKMIRRSMLLWLSYYTSHLNLYKLLTLLSLISFKHFLFFWHFYSFKWYIWDHCLPFSLLWCLHIIFPFINFHVVNYLPLVKETIWYDSSICSDPGNVVSYSPLWAEFSFCI